MSSQGGEGESLAKGKSGFTAEVAVGLAEVLFEPDTPIVTPAAVHQKAHKTGTIEQRGHCRQVKCNQYCRWGTYSDQQKDLDQVPCLQQLS